MMEYDDFIKRLQDYGSSHTEGYSYAYGHNSHAEGYTNNYDFDNEEEDDCVSADLYADGHTLTFELNNFEYTLYCDNMREFKKELWQQIEEIIDECIFESLQQVDEDEDAEG